MFRFLLVVVLVTVVGYCAYAIVQNVTRESTTATHSAVTQQTPVTRVPRDVLDAYATIEPLLHSHYVNTHCGYSFDYPKVWILKEVGPEVTFVHPQDTVLNEVGIATIFAKQPWGSFPDPIAAARNMVIVSTESSGFQDVTIVNTEALSASVWKITFTGTYEGTQLEGEYYIRDVPKDGAPIIYILNLGHLADSSWPEGQAVIDSFALLP